MNNKQVLVYGLLESTNDLRSISVRHIHFKKLQEIRFRSIIFIDKKHFKKGKYLAT